ncbi:MAG: beta-N-acetylhexosaminidase [Kiritimatiellia bacterium]
MKNVIFPVPCKMRVAQARVALGGADWIVLPAGCSRRLREHIEDGAGRLSACLNRALQIVPVVPRQGDVLLALRLVKRGIPAQGYKLTLSDNIRRIEACDEAGLFYGYQAFRQWIEQYGNHPPVIDIEDAPDFAQRGVMLDVSRCKVPTMETCKRLIDRLAGLRINQIQLYIEHTFAFSAHQTVWADASPFTHAEIMELDQYCADRFVELVPNLNSFGHVERWLRHPEYRHLAECPDMERCSTLAPNQASLRFLEELYDEYLPCFSSSMFNVGCDETWELGKGRSKKRSAQIGTTAVYLEFLLKIHRLVTKSAKRMQFWGDIILHQPELIAQLPKDMIALNWGYEANHPFAKQSPAFAAAGIDFYVCPGTSAWNSITGRTDNALANLALAAQHGKDNGASGYLITDWGDGGHHQVLPMSYMGFAAGAGYSWNLAANRQADLADVVSRHFFQDASGVLGQFLLDLGRTLNRLPGLKRGNCSAINQMLFWQPQRLELEKVTAAQFRRAGDWLAKLEGMFPMARPQCSDRDLVFQELRHAIASSRYALCRGQIIKSGGGDKQALAFRLRELVISHKAQWLARNRLGGLQESEDLLRKTMVG